MSPGAIQRPSDQQSAARLGRFSPARFRTIQVCHNDRGCPASYSPKHTRLTTTAMGRPMLDVRRREFITMLGSAAAAWPMAVFAQRIDKVRRIGIIANEPWPPLDGLRDGLRGLGYIDGKNMDLLYRYAEGQAERYAALAAELVSLPVDVIITWGTPPSLAAKAATDVIPIIMTSGDPIAVGLVPGLAYPGGNVTGLSSLAAELEGKRLELMSELLPGLSHVAVLSNPTNPYCAVAVESARQAATALHVRLDIVNVEGERELGGALLTLHRTSQMHFSW